MKRKRRKEKRGCMNKEENRRGEKKEENESERSFN